MQRLSKSRTRRLVPFPVLLVLPAKPFQLPLVSPVEPRAPKPHDGPRRDSDHCDRVGHSPSSLLVSGRIRLMAQFLMLSHRSASLPHGM